MSTIIITCTYTVSFFVYRYTWTLGDWGDCSVPGKPSECGSGMRHRDVMCVRQGDVSMTPVDDILCMQGMCDNSMEFPSETCSVTLLTVANLCSFNSL